MVSESSRDAATESVAAAKEQQRAMYSMGDYSYLSRLFAPSAEALVDAAGVTAGALVLDVAAGDGNCALAAARRGAAVTATDITPAQVELGRRRSEQEGLAVGWLEADAEALPFPDGSFDVVLSAFGFIYAPQPEVVVNEALRVVRDGGAIGFTAWPPEGYVGRLNALAGDYLGATGHPHAHDPDTWGVETMIRARLESYVSSLDLRRERMYVRYDSLARSRGEDPGAAVSEVRAHARAMGVVGRRQRADRRRVRRCGRGWRLRRGRVRPRRRTEVT